MKGKMLSIYLIGLKFFLYNIIIKHKNDTVLFVGHGNINQALIAVITQKKASDVFNIKKQPNTAVDVIDIDEDKNHKIILQNCIKHLE